MAPSPAAGKGSDAPRTPTKLGRKPQSSATSRLGQASKSVRDQKPEAESPELPPRPSESDVTEKPEEVSQTAEDTKESAPEEVEEAEDAPGKVSQAGGELEEAEPKPIDEPEDTTGGAEEVAEEPEEEAEDTGDDATEKAGDTADDVEDTADDVTDTTGEAAEGSQRTGEGLLSGARGLAGRASNLAGKATHDPAGAAKDTADGATDTAGEAAEGAGDAVNGVKDTAEDVADQDLPDLSVLKGLEVNEDGIINDKDGNPIGRLVEGDAEDLVGYTIGDEGEILDDDGDLVGRCEILPEKAKELIEEAKGAAEGGPKMPGIGILKGLTVDKAGQILNEDGDFVGQLIEGDPAELQGLEFNENGEILDDEGNVIGRARLHPDAADLVDQDEVPDAELPEGAEGVEGAAEEAGGAVDGAKEEAEGVVDGVKDEADGIEAELPGVEALEGKEVNEAGEILNEEGEVIGQLAEGNIDDVKGLTVNDKGEVVDSEGNVLGKVELAEGAAEKLKEAAAGAIDIRILEGLKVNKKGKILNEEGEEIGELKDGDLKDCAGKTVNEKGEVVDKNGKVVGRVGIVSGEAALEAMKALRERLGEVEEAAPEPVIPDLDTLEGLKVNKKGQILNEDGEPVGELVDGDVAACAGKKVNDKGEVLDKDGKVIGRVKVLPQQPAEAAEEAAEGAQDAAEGAQDAAEGAQDAVEGVEDTAEDAQEVVEDAGPELPPLSILEGLSVNKAGKLVDSKGNIVGELVEGDAKKLSKSGITCDSEGQFWDNKGHVIGRAKTVAVEEPDEEPPFAGLEGLIVVKGGMVEDENGNTVGKVVEGDPKKLVGRAVDEDGDIIDKKGSVVGHAERWEEPEAEPEPEPEVEPEDLSILAGRVVNKQGNVIGDEGVPIARLVEGNAKELAGKKCDKNGQIWNDSGEVIGRCELIPINEREAKPEGPFAGLQGLRVVADGKVADEDDNIVGQIVEGNPKRLVGLAVDEDGDIIDKYGNVKGHAEPLEEQEEEAPPDLSILDGLTLNKQGFLVDSNGIPVGKLVEGNLKELAGRKSDGEGLIHGDTGKVVGRCELIPDNERVSKAEGPFAGLKGLKVVKDGKVEDEDGNVVGVITEGNPKKLIGNSVDEDGDIIDKYGNVKGHAEPWEEEEAPEVDLSALAGCTVNKAGNVVDSSGTILGRVAEGDLATMIGKKVDGKGQIWDNAGNVIGRAELVQGAASGPEGPFAGFENNSVAKDGTVQTQDGTIIGRVIEGDVKRLVGHKVDEDGDINDKNGNTIGKAERWEPEEKERRINPMSGLHVNKEGEVRDQNGDIIGRLTAGDLGHCAGLEIDDNGYVVDNDGNKVGEVTLLENIAEEEEEPQEETEEEKKKKEDAELADKMANICQQTLERIQPVCKQITEYIEKADRTPRDELDEEELVNNVKPLIEEGGRILQECNGALRGLDPDGRIAAQAKGRAGTREATPEEYRLADCLKELTTTVVTTIDNAKKRISDMPHAKKKLNPLWALLTEPLFQIIAAVGLLLAGVLGLVGKLLNGLGLGGLVNGLLGGLGIDKLLSGLGLGSISESLGLGGKKKKKEGGNPVAGLPLVGGLLGGK
ncbi:hypothetical protein AOQ84DRAFT_227241 [Glonium stellatum]|uniref:DUF6987 domain-containing protein n=1 Tax=Glonium stellatum TaxID=574774 RepID=A0A8E2ERN3_9PEZI|nr:hypothetical protein AOQ84DRAFT_227241 [Glonium stellatum]